MPNRILRASILSSESLNLLDPEEEVFFYRLLVHADDFGRFDGRPAVIRGNCFPLKLDDITLEDIHGWLARLALPEVGVLALYEVDGKEFGVFCNWDKHQSIRSRQSKHPAPPVGTQAAREEPYPLERDVEDYLFSSFTTLEELHGVPVVALERQVRFGSGYADITLKTKDALFVFEIKRTRLTNKAVEQLEKYTALSAGVGILIGPTVGPSLDLARCKERNIAVVTYDRDMQLTLVQPSTGFPALLFRAISRELTSSCQLPVVVVVVEDEVVNVIVNGDEDEDEDEDETPTPEHPDPEPISNPYLLAIQTLSDIPGFVSDGTADVKLLRWLERENIPPPKAEEIATSMKSRLSHNPGKGQWEYTDANGKTRRYTDLRATLQTWTRRDSGGVRSPPSNGRYQSPHDRRIAAEKNLPQRKAKEI